MYKFSLLIMTENFKILDMHTHNTLQFSHKTKGTKKHISLFFRIMLNYSMFISLANEFISLSLRKRTC
ncbi:hypothetical protein HanIR_Chr02g0094361 [Helianthus annuus]|nr:hypothetical protein HanIR_Chr02g0094361 [Helianthus annuus]